MLIYSAHANVTQSVACDTTLHTAGCKHGQYLHGMNLSLELVCGPKAKSNVELVLDVSVALVACEGVSQALCM